MVTWRVSYCHDWHVFCPQEELNSTRICSHSYLSNYLGYLREPHWFSMGLPEISRVTWQVWLPYRHATKCRIGLQSVQCWQHWADNGPVLSYYGMCTGRSCLRYISEPGVNRLMRGLVATGGVLVVFLVCICCCVSWLWCQNKANNYSLNTSKHPIWYWGWDKMATILKIILLKAFSGI